MPHISVVAPRSNPELISPDPPGKPHPLARHCIGVANGTVSPARPLEGGPLAELKLKCQHMAQSHAAGELLERYVCPGFCTTLLSVDMHYGRPDAWKSAEEYAMLLTLLTTLAAPDSKSGKVLQALRQSGASHTFGVLAWCTPGEDRELNALLKTLIRPRYLEEAKYLLTYPERYRQQDGLLYRARYRVPLMGMIAWPDDSAVLHAKAAVTKPAIAPRAVIKPAVNPRSVPNPVVEHARPKVERGVDPKSAEVFEQWKLEHSAKKTSTSLGGLTDWVKQQVQRHLTSVRAATPNEFGFVSFESHRPDKVHKRSDGRFETETFPPKRIFARERHDKNGERSGTDVVCITMDQSAMPKTNQVGSFKQVVEESSGKLVFSPRFGKAFHRPRVSADRYADLRSIIPTIPVSPQYMYARDGGETLERYLKTVGNPYLGVKDFLPLIRDLDRLHERGLYHLDIKDQNIAVKIDPQSKKVRGMALIDTDGITGVAEEFNWTEGLMSYPQVQRMADSEEVKRLAEAKAGQNGGQSEALIRSAQLASQNAAAAFRTADHYAMLLTVIEASGFALNDWGREMEWLNRQGLPAYDWDLLKIEPWLADNVKAKYRGEIRQLLLRPEKTTLSVPLAEVFKV